MLASATKAKTAAKTEAMVKTGVDTFSKTSLIAMGVVSAVIGIWAIACIVGAIISSNGPLEIMQGWFSAFTGQ